MCTQIFVRQYNRNRNVTINLVSISDYNALESGWSPVSEWCNVSTQFRDQSDK